jgi:hypothetical protein
MCCRGLIELQTFQVAHHGTCCASGHMRAAEVGAIRGGNDVIQDVNCLRQIPLVYMTNSNAYPCITPSRDQDTHPFIQSVPGLGL